MGGSYFDQRDFTNDKETLSLNSNRVTKNKIPNILVTDDSIMVKKQICQFLKSGGYNVIGQSDRGEESIELYKKHFPQVDLVIMDTTMPGLSGFEAVEKILEFDGNAKVVMICGLGKEDIAQKAVNIGALRYIVKPLYEDEFLNAVSEALNH